MNALKDTPIYLRANKFIPKTSEPQWLVKIRQNAFDRFTALGFPTRKNEAWKYIYLEGLLNRQFLTGPGPEIAGAWPRLKDFANRFVFINGKLDLENSTAQSLPYLTTDLHQIEWAQPCLAHETTPETNPFVPVNTFQFTDGVFIRVPKETAIAEPLHVFFISSGNNDAPPVFYPRILVVAETGSKFEMVLHHLGQNNESYFMNSVAEFFLAPNSQGYCFNRQENKEQAVHFMNVRARLETGSRLEIVGTATGGSIIRNDIHVDLDGAEAFCSLAGLAALAGKSQAFQHVSVNHRFLNCTSRQIYKNILAGDSVAEFNSLVHVWRCAQKSDSEQLDKNLLLSENARVYSRPQLRIDNDDVRASHGAATGRLEKDELFYLQSRGFPKELARFLLIYGFAKEVLEKIRPEELRRQLEPQWETQVREIVNDKHKAPPP